MNKISISREDTSKSLLGGEMSLQIRGENSINVSVRSVSKNREHPKIDWKDTQYGDLLTPFEFDNVEWDNTAPIIPRFSFFLEK